MSRSLCNNKGFELLEPYEGKLSRTVLREERGSNAPDLPDFIRESYRPELGKDDLSFLDRSYERHFNERPFLHHSVYLCLTKTTKQRMVQRSDFSTLCRGTLLPKEVRERDAVLKFLEAVDQFERIINDSGCMRLRRLSADEIAGTDDKRGLLDRYLSLRDDAAGTLEDLRLGADEVRIGDQILCLHTLSDTDDLPAAVATDGRYERLSTDRSRICPVRGSTAVSTAVGVFLGKKAFTVSSAIFCMAGSKLV